MFMFNSWKKQFAENLSKSIFRKNIMNTVPSATIYNIVQFFVYKIEKCFSLVTVCEDLHIATMNFYID